MKPRLLSAALAASVAVPGWAAVAPSPAAAAPFCTGVGLARTASPLYYPPGPVKQTSYFASFIANGFGCAATGSLDLATCAGGVLFDGTPVSLTPMHPERCQAGGPGEVDFSITIG